MDFMIIEQLAVQLLSAALKAAATVQADTGKPWDQVLVDVVNHLTPGMPGAPSLI